MSATTSKPFVNNRIFWDVDLNHLDYDQKSKFIVERVFNRGDVEDIRNCRRYYSDKIIADILLDSKFIMDHRIHLISAILDQPLSAFKCYTQKQLNPTLYPY